MSVVMYLLIGVILVWFVGLRILTITEDDDVVDMISEGLPGAMLGGVLVCIAIAFWPFVVPIMLVGWYLVDQAKKRQARNEKAQDL